MLKAKIYMHIFKMLMIYVHICATFQNDCLKTLGGVDYTNLLKARRTDRQTDGQVQNIMPPDYHHGGIKCNVHTIGYIYKES